MTEKKPNSRIQQEGDRWWCDLNDEDRNQTFAALVRTYAPESISWKKARHWIATGKVFLDEVRLDDSAKRYTKGARLEVRMSSPRRAFHGELDVERIVYVDADVVVVEKPAGLITNTSRDDDELTLELLTRGALQRMRKGRAKEPLYTVHRLDKDSSGLLVFARHRKARNALREQFSQHTTQREYYALVSGVPEEQWLETWLVEDRGDGYRGSVPKQLAKRKNAQRAAMHLRIVETYNAGKLALVACRLETGRTHQIRVQMSELGHPLVGDRVYMKAFLLKGNTLERLPEFSRVALHARTLGFLHPGTGESLHFQSELASEMKALLGRLTKDKAVHHQKTPKSRSAHMTKKGDERKSPSRTRGALRGPRTRQRDSESTDSSRRSKRGSERFESNSPASNTSSRQRKQGRPTRSTSKGRKSET